MVAEDKEERVRERGKIGEDPGSWSSERDCLISAGQSDGFDRPQAPIRLQD